MNVRDPPQQHESTTASGTGGKTVPSHGFVSGTGAKTVASHGFVSDIQQMMHGLGDCKKPILESAVLVEEITQQQMTLLLHKAADIACWRGSKVVGAEDILFLMRKDKVKLRRLLRFMDMKDLKASALRGASGEDDEAEGDVKGQTGRKRRKVCYEFLSTIDQTGELLDLFEDEEVDDIKYERLLRAELKSRCLDPQQYLEFCVARQVNFSRRHKSQRFKDWLMSGVNVDVKPSQLALELFSYLAYETVAQIVDLCLLVKQDAQRDITDPLALTTPSVSHNLDETTTVNILMGGSKLPSLTSPTVSPPSTPSILGQSTSSTLGSSGSGPQLMGASAKAKQKKKKKGNLAVALETTVTKAITVADIHEAMRRYMSFVGPFASEIKVNTCGGPRMHILCI